MINFTAKRDVRYIGTDFYIEDLDHLKIELDLSAYVEIKRLQGLATQAGAFAVLTVVSPDWYVACDEDGKKSDYREYGAEMIVRNNIVFFGGYEKHSDTRWECDSIGIPELDAHFKPETGN